MQLCGQPGCPALVKRGRCIEHGGMAAGRREYDQERGSASRRGYDAGWRVFRIDYLRRHPLCVDCRRALATEVHHRIKYRDRPDLKRDEANLRPLCKPCHSRRTGCGE